MYMLDTDICSYVLKEHPAEVLKRFDEVERGQLCLSVITQAELLYGAEKLQSKKLTLLVNRFLSRLTILPWTEQCSVTYANNRNNLDKAGTPIGNMDLLIASHAMALKYTLVTNNTRHFSKVKGLQLDNWVE